MSAARQLAPSVNGQVTVYLVGRQKDLLTDTARRQWELVQDLKLPNLKVKQDVFAPDIESNNIF